MNRKTNPWVVLSVTSLGLSLVNVNLGALNVVLPAIARHFQASAAVASWILLSFLVVNTVLILVFGQFSDLYGRRQLYLLGMAIFTVVSLVLGFAPNVWVFLGLRVLQAAGGALIIANNTPLITDALPKEVLGKGLGFNIVISSLAQLIGPVVGGVIASRFGWQWVFWSGVPIGVIGFAWGLYALRHVPARESGKTIDWAGGVLTFFAVSGLIVGLSEGGTMGWTSPLVLIGLALFAGVTPLLVGVELRAESPMYDFSLFRNLTYSMANVSTFLNAFTRLSVVLLYSLYLQAEQGVDAFWVGLEILPVPIGMMVASPIAGSWSGRSNVRVLSTVGLGISAIGLVILIGSLRPDGNYLVNAIAMLLVGFGSGLFQTPNTRSIMMSVPEDRRGFANALRSMLQNMGQVLSTVISLTIVTAALPPNLQDAVFKGSEGVLSRSTQQLMTGGYRLAFVTLLLATLIGMAASYLRGTPKPREVHG